MVRERLPLAHRLWAGFRRDVGGLLAALAPLEPPQPGLYTYRLKPKGGQLRIHLRIYPTCRDHDM